MISIMAAMMMQIRISRCIVRLVGSKVVDGWSRVKFMPTRSSRFYRTTAYMGFGQWLTYRPVVVMEVVSC